MYEGKHIHYSEVDRKPLCSYSPKLCKQRRLNGYAFCIRHVLEDRSAPFRQCEYVAKYNSQRCTNPIPKTQDRKYCSSHLQVMGVLPKKERKKKQGNLESLALNITVPSLALKASKYLDYLSPPSPSSFASLLPLDPSIFFKEEKLKKEGPALGNKPPNHGILNPHQKHKDHAVTLAVSKQSASHPSSQQTGGAHVSAFSKFAPKPTSQNLKSTSGQLCTKAQAGRQPLSRPSISNSKSETCPKLALAKKVGRATPGLSPKTESAPGHPAMVLSPLSQQQAPCLVQLHRLMEEQRRKHEDLKPRFGLDWSDDSGEEDQCEVEKVASVQYRRIQIKCAGDSGSREGRLAGLCSYLRQRHKHLLREERGFRRERKSHHALRKSLLQAATHDPYHTAQVVQNRNTDTSSATRPAGSRVSSSDSGPCVAQVNGKTCINRSLPFTRHCFQHILQNRSQQLFSSCTARFADGAQCSIPVFDITHQTPLCEEHAKKMDNFLRGDVSRRTYHYQQQLQQRRRLKKAKLPALSKKHKKKGRRGAVRRPQKPIPPVLPQGNLGMSSVLGPPTQPTGVRGRPLTPDLSADELPDDITSDISDIPHDLELNQEDFSDVLPRFPDDLQDFDLFEGKPHELLPTSEEAEELVRVLQDMGSYPESLACLSSMAELGPVEGSDCRGMEGGMMDLLSARLSAETLSNLELDPSLLPSTEEAFSSFPRSSASSASQRSQRRHLAHCDDPKDDLGDEDVSHGSWGVLALPLGDSTQLHNFISSDGLLMSTALSTPPTPMPTAPCQSTTTLSAIPETSLTIPVTSPSTSSTRMDFLFPGQLKHTLPSLFSHCGIPADLQPHHSAPAPTVDRT